jgi:hypothetical protein
MFPPLPEESAGVASFRSTALACLGVISTSTLVTSRQGPSCDLSSQLSGPQQHILDMIYVSVYMCVYIYICVSPGVIHLVVVYCFDGDITQFGLLGTIFRKWEAPRL